MLIKDLDRIEPDHYYTIALSGGSTPEYIFQYLSDNYAGRISWEKLLVFWGDERCVPPEDRESNYRMAYENLLQNVPIPDANIFRIRGEDDPAKEARQYAGLVSSMVPFFNGIPSLTSCCSDWVTTDTPHPSSPTGLTSVHHASAL
ncbi:MAG: 6-phosphogluconolactonase [Marinilabiliales bacterium]|nr:6-phosphogluconolactonase [Marinilabiliales bacterium]